MRALCLVLVLCTAAPGQDTFRELRDRLEIGDPGALDEVGRRGKNAAILERFVMPLADKNWRAVWALARMQSRSDAALATLARHLDNPAAREGLRRAGEAALAHLGESPAADALRRRIRPPAPPTIAALLALPAEDDALRPLLHLDHGTPPGIAAPTLALAARGKAAVNELIAALPSLRAIYALALIGKDAAPAESALLGIADSKSEASHNAIWALGRIGARDKPTVGFLRQRLFSVQFSSRVVQLDRILAACALIRMGRSGQPAASSLYAIGRKAMDRPIRCQALRSLYLADKKDVGAYVVDGARELMRERDDRIAAAAAFVYLRFRENGGTFFWRLGDIYKRAPRSLKIEIVKDVGNTGFFHPSVRGFLLAALKEKDGTIRFEAIRACGKVGVKSKRIFAALLKTKFYSPPTREEICKSLAANAGTLEGLPQWTGVLRYRAPRNAAEVRLLAAAGFEPVFHPGLDLVEAVRSALRSPQPDARRRAVAMLARLGETEGLQELYADTDVAVRVAVWRALDPQ